MGRRLSARESSACITASRLQSDTSASTCPWCTIAGFTTMHARTRPSTLMGRSPSKLSCTLAADSGVSFHKALFVCTFVFVFVSH